MTRGELAALVPGDSLIGFSRRWHDEYVVVRVGPVVRRASSERIFRAVTVRTGSHTLTRVVRDAGPEIRGARRGDWRD